MEGQCACGQVRYRLLAPAMFVNCCHCRSCQRESGSAFALNALIESDKVELLSGELEEINTPSFSGKGQKIIRCRQCKVALWSHYAGAGAAVSFVRVGTLDYPDQFSPDIHIFTAFKQAWVVLPPDVPAVAEYYDPRKYWPAASQARYKLAKAGRAG